MSAQAVFGWWPTAVEAERDRPRSTGCREGIFASRPPTSRENATCVCGGHPSRLDTVLQILELMKQFRPESGRLHPERSKRRVSEALSGSPKNACPIVPDPATDRPSPAPPRECFRWGGFRIYFFIVIPTAPRTTVSKFGSVVIASMYFGSAIRGLMLWAMISPPERTSGRSLSK